MWLFALMAHDGLSNVHPAYWGFPLVLSLFYLVCFAAHACYQDFAELKEGLAKEEAGQSEDGDGIEEPESAADGADAASAIAADFDPWASTEEDADAGAEADAYKQDEEDARVAEPSNIDLAIDVMLCNYRDETDVNGKSASADAASTSEPPPPEAEDEAWA